MPKITCHMKSGVSFFHSWAGIRIPAEPTELDVTAEQVKVIRGDCQIVVDEWAGDEANPIKEPPPPPPAPEAAAPPKRHSDDTKPRRSFSRKRR